MTPTTSQYTRRPGLSTTCTLTNSIWTIYCIAQSLDSKTHRHGAWCWASGERTCTQRNTLHKQFFWAIYKIAQSLGSKIHQYGAWCWASGERAFTQRNTFESTTCTKTIFLGGITCTEFGFNKTSTWDSSLGVWGANPAWDTILGVHGVKTTQT